MQTSFFLWISLSVLAALFLSWYHYAYKSRLSAQLIPWLTGLRFLAWLGAFLLLINLQFRNETYEVIPPNLVVLADNSSSMAHTGAAATAQEQAGALAADDALAQRFRVYRYAYGGSLERTDSLSFEQPVTNITNALRSLNEIYARTNTAILLLSDGNQTLGEDYEFAAAAHQLPVFSIATGDTTRYADLRIEQINSNSYAFLDNQFPLETQISYEGPGSVDARMEISRNGDVLERKTLSFGPETRSITVNSLLKADRVGVQNITVSLGPLDNERNTSNNSRTLAIEVVDEQSRVVLVSDILHPDIGTLQKAIESNEQRKVEVVKPAAALERIEEADLVIMYQPVPKFKEIYEYIQRSNTPIFTIAGPRTDWDFLNDIQTAYVKDAMGQVEEVLPILNSGFSLFDISGISLTDFPPLNGELGEILITKPHESLIGERIRSVDTGEPLMAFIEHDHRKEVVLFGEHLWKWRMADFRLNGNFDSFDALIGKIMLYLSDSESKRRFTVEYDRVFQGSNEAGIQAAFFDETFAFNSSAVINVRVRGSENDVDREFPMLLKNNYYEADLSDLPAGSYSFTASVRNTDFTESGVFQILDFDVEKQLVTTDHGKLGRLSEKTGASLFFPGDLQQLKDSLLSSPRFLPVQKSKQIVVSLIDFRWLLGLIALALAGEWLIRKYNGLI